MHELDLRGQQLEALGPRPQESADFGPRDVEAGEKWDQRKREADLDLERTLEHERLRQARTPHCRLRTQPLSA